MKQSLILSAFLLAFAIVANGAEITVTPDARYQTIEGWGASSNFFEEDLARVPDSLRQQMFDLVFRDLGSNILCIRLYARFQTEEGGAYNWNVMSAQRMILTEALRRGNINYVWVKVSSPPGWMKDNGDDANGGHVLVEHYQDYADYLADYFIGMDTTYGFRLDGLSIFNEPGFEPEYESTGTTPEEYRDILKVVHRTFQERGLGYVRLHGPESGHITGDGGALSRYLPVIMADEEAAEALDIMQTHQYGDYRMIYGIGPADDWAGLRRLADEHDKPVWESEIFVGGAGQGQYDIMEGLRASQFIWTAMTLGTVEAWHYWQYLNPISAEGNSPGIIAYNSRQMTFTVAPRYYVLKHWMSNVPVGSVRLEATSDTDSLFAAAYQTSDSAFTIVAFNLTTDTLETSFQTGTPIGSVLHIRTSGGENYSDLGTLEPRNGQFTLSILPRSISTFLISFDPENVSEAAMPTTQALLSAFPNPFNSTVTIAWSLQHPQEVTLNLTDVLGREVRRIEAGRLGRGNHVKVIDAAGLAPGVYYVGIGEETQHRKAIVLVK